MNVYAIVKAFSLPHIKAYHNDLLVHDREAIEANPGVPFLHWTGDCGTHIVFLPPLNTYPARGVEVPYLFSTADRKHLIRSVEERCNYHAKPFAVPMHVVLYYNGKSIKVIGVQRATEIGREYCQRLMSEVERQDNVYRNANAMCD